MTWDVDYGDMKGTNIDVLISMVSATSLDVKAFHLVEARAEQCW